MLLFSEVYPNKYVDDMMKIFKINRQDVKSIGTFLKNAQSDFDTSPQQHMYVFEGKSKKRDYSNIINNVTQLIASTNDKRQLNPAKELSTEKI